jgi:hypothetical protein
MTSTPQLSLRRTIQRTRSAHPKGRRDHRTSAQARWKADLSRRVSKFQRAWSMLFGTPESDGNAIAVAVEHASRARGTLSADCCCPLLTADLPQLGPFFGLGQPVVRLSIGDTSTLPTHDFQSIKPTFRIHLLLHIRPIAFTEWQILLSIQNDQIMFGNLPIISTCDAICSALILGGHSFGGGPANAARQSRMCRARSAH